jgi:hypothetical protein
MSTVIKLDTTGLDKIAAKLDMRTEQVLKATAFQVEAEAKAIVQQKHIIDTGNLLNSINTRRINSKTYRVDVGAEYGIFIELGHLTKPFRKSYGVQRFVAARPFLTPAVERVRAHLDKLFARLFET